MGVHLVHEVDALIAEYRKSIANFICNRFGLSLFPSPCTVQMIGCRPSAVIYHCERCYLSAIGAAAGRHLSGQTDTGSARAACGRCNLHRRGISGDQVAASCGPRSCRRRLPAVTCVRCVGRVCCGGGGGGRSRHSIPVVAICRARDGPQNRHRRVTRRVRATAPTSRARSSPGRAGRWRHPATGPGPTQSIRPGRPPRNRGQHALTHSGGAAAEGCRSRARSRRAGRSACPV